MAAVYIIKVNKEVMLAANLQKDLVHQCFQEDPMAPVCVGGGGGKFIYNKIATAPKIFFFKLHLVWCTLHHMAPYTSVVRHLTPHNVCSQLVQWLPRPHQLLVVPWLQ